MRACAEDAGDVCMLTRITESRVFLLARNKGSLSSAMCAGIRETDATIGALYFIASGGPPRGGAGGSSSRTRGGGQ